MQYFINIFSHHYMTPYLIIHLLLIKVGLILFQDLKQSRESTFFIYQLLNKIFLIFKLNLFFL